MKNKTNRLHFSTRTLAMVLSIVMLIGSIATGSMLNTFAAYLKDNVNSDAVSQAASEGSDIARSAIPSDDTAAQADNEEEKPDLSGFEENEIVRGMKQDLADTGAKADLASTGNWNDMDDAQICASWDSSGNYSSNWNWYNWDYFDWDGDKVHCSFRLKANTTYYFYGQIDFGNNNYAYACSTFTFNSNNGIYDNPGTDTSKYFTLETGSSATGYVNVDIQFHKSYNGNASVQCYFGATSADAYLYGIVNGDNEFDISHSVGLTASSTSGKYYYDADVSNGAMTFRTKLSNYFYAANQNSDKSLSTTASDTWKKGGWNEGNAFTLTPTEKTRIWVDGSAVNVVYDGVKLSYTTSTYYLKGNFDNWQSGIKLYYSDEGENIYKSAETVSLKSGTNNDTYMKVFNSNDNKWTGLDNGSVGTSKTTLANEGSGGNFKTSLNGEYYFCYDAGTNEAWFEAPAPSEAYYVANFAITGNEWNKADPDGAMTLSSGTTWTKTFTGLNPASENSYDCYFRIADGTDCLTVNGDSLSGNAQPAFGTGDDFNNVIFTLGPTDTSWTVTITYDSATRAVTVNALEAEEEEESGGWKYTKTGADAEPEISGSNNSKYIVYNDDDNLWNDNTGRQFSSSSDVHYSNNEYWVDLTSMIGNKSEFYFALNSNNSGNAIVGQGSIKGKINGVTYDDNCGPDPNFGSIAGFNVTTKQHGDYNGNIRVMHVTVTDSTKFTAIGVIIKWDGGANQIDYNFYYKGVSTAPTPTKNQNFKVYAKDGTITETDYGFGKYADTTISDTKSTDYTQNTTDAHGEYYYTGTFTLGKTDTTGNTLTVTTTVDSANRAELYVKGWSVNGATYGYNESDTIDSTNGVYTLELKVTYEDFKDAPEKGANKIIEITPIFYLKDAKTVSFRVENFDKEVQSEAANCGGWGSTLYAYPFYGALSNVDNSFGAYPGQPLIYYDGKYSIQIPIESISLKAPDTDGTLVRGITLNNGYFDNAHKDAYGWSTTAQHKQTYDFDDFYKIFNEKNANDIIFRFKYRANNKAYNHDTYFNDDSLSATEITTLESDKGWEVLKDRLGRVIDIFGNPILKNGSTTEYATELNQVANGTTSHLYIVSMGYFDNNAGEYATEWNIYNHSGTRLQYSADKHSIVPSALLLNNSTRFATTVYKTYRDKPIGYYQNMYDYLNTTSVAKGKPAVIAYERDQERTNNAFRSDGRWYYTTKTDYVQSNIKIQYKTPAGAYVDDTYKDKDDITDITGVTTGAKAYFTNTKYENKRQSLSEIYSADPKDKYTFTTVDGDNYQFSGWYLEIDGDTDKPTYTPINPVDGIYSVSRTSSDVLVARFDPIKAGTVKISHNLGEGSGTVDVKVEYGTTGSYTTLRDYGTAANTAGYTVSSSYVKATNRDKNIKITLKTIAGTDNTFANYTASDAISSNTTYFPDGTGTPSGSGVTTKEIVIPISTLLDNNTSALTYFSNLTPPTYKYEITYNYTSTRLKTSGGQNASMSYTAKGTMTPTAYKNNVTIDGETRTLSTAFISDVAPHESNFKQILSFGAGNITNNNVVVDGTTYTQKATVTFVAQDSKNQSGVIDLPYRYKNAVGSDNDTAYAPQTTYTDYSTLTDYCTLQNIDMPTQTGMLEDHSTEPFIINTVYGGYFVTSESKTGIDFFDDENKKYIITAPETIMGSEEKNVTKYTIDQDRTDPNNPVNKTWADYTGDAYTAEIKRILGVEGLDDTQANRDLVQEEYTYTYNGVAYKCYRVSTETHYVPNNTTKYFQYWSIEDLNHNEVARCYSRELNYLAFENYHITPIYDNDRFELDEDISTSISYMGESRNQWNYDGGLNVKTTGTDGLIDPDDAAAADYIWEDFAVDFQYKGERLNDYTGSEADGMRMGVVIQVAGKRIGEESSSGYYKEYYKSGESTSDVQTYLTNKYLSGSTTATGKYIDRSINRTNLNNKNREDYYLRIANSYGWDSVNEVPTHVDANYSGNVLRVYSYFIVGNQVYVSSNPAYFCSYGIAKQ